jgi:type III pantothenate kinase
MLLVDIGNSRIKGVCDDNGELLALPPLATGVSSPFADWQARLSNRRDLRRILVSNVAGPEVAGAFGQFAFEHWRVEPEFVHPRRECAGMKTRYDNPEQLGVDRWLSALAAYDSTRGAVCVIDAGTALTVDIVDHGGEHLGGLIAPGPDLMRESLTRRTAQLEARSASRGSGFATNTRDAISRGCDAAVRGLFTCVERDLAATVPATSFHWYLTGGAAGSIRHLLDVDYEDAPDLVLRGLALVGRVGT